MILAAALLLAAFPIEEAEHALAAGRGRQAEEMVEQLIAAGQKGDRLDRLRAGVALANGRYQEALSLYSQLAGRMPADPALAYGAAYASFRLGKRAEAQRWSALSVAGPGGGWRAWNLCGVIADGNSEFDRSDQCFARALELAPNRFEVLNNQGWSHLLRGQWAAAADFFSKALLVNPASPVARANLDLARVAMSDDLPPRRDGETEAAYAARLNDAGVIAEAAGDRKRAIAAFANAVAMRSTWSERTARNLADAEGR